MHIRLKFRSRKQFKHTDTFLESRPGDGNSVLGDGGGEKRCEVY